jgi:hypothetical protein
MWACIRLADVNSAARLYHSMSAFQPIPDAPGACSCGYCGKHFTAPIPDHRAAWLLRIQHLTTAHRFGECHRVQRFFQLDHFRQHLKYNHGAIQGFWIRDIENKCLIKSHLINEDLVLRRSEELINIVSKYYVPDIAEYLQTSETIHRLKFQSEIISTHRDIAFPYYFGTQLGQFQDELGWLIRNLEAGKVHMREAAWERGCSLDLIDALIQGDQKNDLRSGRRAGMEVPSVNEARAWRTQTDRINAWLLQCLQSSEEQADLHRSFLPDGKKIERDKWARMVLKFWPLDEAAIWAGDRVCSTNGAVDSDGAAHSARVFLRSDSRSVKQRQPVISLEDLDNDMESLVSWHTAPESNKP